LECEANILMTRVWSNRQRAKTLDRLAGETSELSDEAFFAISPYFNWSSAHWTNAVSLAARRVEYHHDVRTFSAFVNTLIAILRVAA
jgi:hypothetical protein